MGGNVGKIEKWKLHVEPLWTTQMDPQPWTYYSASASHNAEDQLNMCNEQTNVYQRMKLTGLYEPVYHSGSRQSLNNIH